LFSTAANNWLSLLWSCAEIDCPTASTAATSAIVRLADGNASNVKSIGEGAAELRINRGPGYRVYFGWDGSVHQAETAERY
jgi:putative addiction module killer protein